MRVLIDCRMSVFRQSQRRCPKTRSADVAESRESCKNRRKSTLCPSALRLPLGWFVRLTPLSDEHTTIAIRSGDANDAGATLTVPLTGVELIAVERALIQFALDLHGGNRTHAAAFLGLSRSALLYRIQKYHLDLTSSRRPDREQS